MAHDERQPAGPRLTKAEKAWIAAIQDLGCVVCIVDLGIWGTPPDVHHMLSGGRRRGHLFTLPLCPPHHRWGFAKGVVSRDQCQRSFEERYGSEDNLLEITKRLVSTREAERDQDKSVNANYNILCAEDS